MSTLECDSGCRLAVKRVALGPAVRLLGDGGAGHPLGGGCVGPGARRGGDSDSDMALQRAVAGRVIRDAVLPTAPHDPAPATAEGADRAGVVVPAGEGGGVQVLRPRVMVAAGVRERDERLARGEYGICRDCGLFMGLGRLKALPFAPRCTACQAEVEAGELRSEAG